jgi:hypothetical protein
MRAIRAIYYIHIFILNLYYLLNFILMFPKLVLITLLVAFISCQEPKVQYNKDKLLACMEILNQKINKDQRTINSTAQTAKNYIGQDAVIKKILSDMVNKCYNSISNESVLEIFKDGVFMDPQFESELGETLLSVMYVDYSDYNSLNPNEFNIPKAELSLYTTYQNISNEYKQNQKISQDKIKNEFHLLGFSLGAIPLKVKALFGLCFFAVLMVAILKLLTNVMKNDKNTKAAISKKNKIKTY